MPPGQGTRTGYIAVKRSQDSPKSGVHKQQDAKQVRQKVLFSVSTLALYPNPSVSCMKARFFYFLPSDFPLQLERSSLDFTLLLFLYCVLLVLLCQKIIYICTYIFFKHFCVILLLTKCNVLDFLDIMFSFLWFFINSLYFIGIF